MNYVRQASPQRANQQMQQYYSKNYDPRTTSSYNGVNQMYALPQPEYDQLKQSVRNQSLNSMTHQQIESRRRNLHQQANEIIRKSNVSDDYGMQPQQ